MNESPKKQWKKKPNEFNPNCKQLTGNSIQYIDSPLYIEVYDPYWFFHSIEVFHSIFYTIAFIFELSDNIIHAFVEHFCCTVSLKIKWNKILKRLPAQSNQIQRLRKTELILNKWNGLLCYTRRSEF